ncbi:MAG TPA: L,D-transpeptidase [Gaiellaceae bacterium]|nr:L,D-transpeptidase [Gaiellaceae bacterium]
MLTRLGRRTRFGSPTSLAVTHIVGNWAEVISSALPNRTRGYVSLTAISVTLDPVKLEVDLSGHRLRVWHARKLVRTLPVATGAPVSPTPTGRFSITDELVDFDRYAYGCCVLALSGHQVQFTPGWRGGDRLAIHGGGGLGDSITNGCLHASERDLHWLMRVVPLGTQIVIHR